MAVEIPVVIDIDGAFQEAAKRVGVAIVPLRDSVEKLTKDLGRWQEVLKKTKIGDDKFIVAAKNIQNVSEALAVADYEMRRIGSNEGSIKRMSIDLAELNRRWTEMGKDQKFDSAGNLSADARNLWEQYKKITAELEKEGMSLAKMEEEERKVLNAAKRRQELSAQGAKKRQYENAILNSTVKTMRVLQEQERILSDRLNRTVIGSDKYKKLQEDLRKVQAEMRAAAGSTNAATAAFSRQSGVIARLTGTLASYASVFTALRFAKQIRDVTAEFEYQRVALGHLIQDEEYGAELFEKIKERAVESPFRIKDLLTYTKQLASYRIEQERLFDTMDRLADVSAGLGVDMNRLILAYGQVRSASVLRGQELRQFTESGISLVQLLADKFTELNGKAVKTADVFELISKRAVPFSMISEIFEDMTDAGGMFYHMQEVQAETIKGKWEKLKDVFDKSLQAIGNTKSFTNANQALLKILNALARNLEYIPKTISALTHAWVAYSVATLIVNSRHKQAIAYEVRLAASQKVREVGIPRLTARVLGQARAEELLTKAFAKQMIATNALSKTFWKLTAAMLSNPIGVLAAAVAAVYGLMAKFRMETDKTVNSFKEFDDVIESVSEDLRDYNKIDKLINRYERLALKTDRTVKENNRLYETMTMLQERFSGVEIGINAENSALDKQIEKLRELNEINEKEARRRGEGTLGAKQVELTEAERKREKLYKERLKLIQKVADLERELAFNDLYKESPEWKKAKLRIGEINEELKEQDKLVSGLQKRIQRLYYILNPESAENPFNAWQRQIQAMRDITVGDITSQIFTDEQIDKWETLDAALSDIDKRKNEVRKREDQLSAAIKNQTGEIREQIQAELDWARAERIRLEAMEEFFKSPTIYGKDIINNFSKLLSKTYDEGNIQSYGKALLGYLSMQTNIKFNPELLARPLVDAAVLVEKGWENAGEGIATVFSSVYDWTDDKGEKHNIMVTPILPDGSVLSPSELDEYVKGVLGSADFSDEKHLVLGIDVSGDAGEKLHEMQEEFYGLMEMRENLPEKFLISDDEISNLRTATDVLGLVESKVKAVEEEFKKIEKIKLDPNIGDDVIKAAEQYETHLQAIYDLLISLRGRYTDPLSGIAKDVKEFFPNLMEEAFAGVDKETFAKIGLFSDEDLLKITNVIDLYSIWASKIEAVTKEMENYNKQLGNAISDEQRQKITAAIESLSPQKEGLEEMGKLYGFVRKTSEPKRSAEQDPWILIYKNRMKFMQDFRNGVEDLDNYLLHSQSLAEQQRIMEGRGAALGFDVKMLTGTRQELLAWYDETIGKIKDKISALGGRQWADLGVQAILAKDTKSKVLKAWQDLLAEVFNQKTDFELENMKKDLEAALDKLAQDVKRSEEARNFYDDILGLTGDEELAANLSVSVYGGTGDEFKKRMQQELDGALQALKETDGFDVSKELEKAFGDMNFAEILKIEDLPDKVREAVQKVQDTVEKHNAEIGKSYAKLLMKYDDIEQQRVDITNKYTNEIRTIHEGLALELAAIDKKSVSDSEKVRLREAANSRAAAASASARSERDLGLSRLERDYRLFFSSVGVISEKSAARIAQAQKKMLTDQFVNGQISLSRYKREIKEVNEQLKKYATNKNPLGEYLEGGVNALIGKVEEFSDSMLGFASSIEVKKGGFFKPTNEEKDFLSQIDKVLNFGKFSQIFSKDRVIKIEARINEAGQKAYNHAILEGKSAAEAQIAANAAAKAEAAGAANEISAVTSQIAGGIASFEQYFYAVSSFFSSMERVVNQYRKNDSAIVEDWVYGLFGLNRGITSGYEKLKSGDIFGAFFDIGEGFANMINPVERWEDKIEDQNKIVEGLEYQYDRLEKSIQEAFGSDYISNYNKQLEVLYAKQAAYEEQARLERAKEKNADSQKIKGYEDAARDVGDQILDMQSQLSEFFSGTDLTSAAKDFANAWIDAYKEFGSTTDAMREKFNDMLQNMVENSLAAKIMQEILAPLFQQIDDMAADSELSGADIAQIAASAPEYIDKINAAMSSLMAGLTAAGYNIRQQPGQFTGIKRNIANATEESINGLTQATNVSNFYMAGIYNNVASILAVMTGGTTEQPNSGTQALFNNELALQYMSALPNIDQNIAELLRAVKSVISDKNSSTNLNVIAVRA